MRIQGKESPLVRTHLVVDRLLRRPRERHLRQLQAVTRRGHVRGDLETERARRRLVGFDDVVRGHIVRVVCIPDDDDIVASAAPCRKIDPVGNIGWFQQPTPPPRHRADIAQRAFGPVALTASAAGCGHDQRYRTKSLYHALLLTSILGRGEWMGQKFGINTHERPKRPMAWNAKSKPYAQSENHGNWPSAPFRPRAPPYACSMSRGRID